jgi:hypothetical protein
VGAEWLNWLSNRMHPMLAMRLQPEWLISDPTRHRTGEVWHVWGGAFPRANSIAVRFF